MTDINPTPSWAAVRQLEIGEFALGGANGNMNDQAKSLAARSEFLKQRATYQYNTLTEANADIANIAVNQNVNVVDSGRHYKATAGATSLTKSPYDPVQLSKLNAASLSVIGNYLTEASKRDIASLSESSTKYLIAKAIKKVAITNPTVGKQYNISSIYKNVTSSGSRIIINDDVGSQSSISIPAATVVSGLQEYTLSGLKSGKVLIDWDVLSNGLTVTNLDLFFDNNRYLQEYLNTANIATNATNTAQNAVAIETLKPALLPDWVVSSQANAILNANESVKKIVKAIKGISITGATTDQYLKLATV